MHITTVHIISYITMYTNSTLSTCIIGILLVSEQCACAHVFSYIPLRPWYIFIWSAVNLHIHVSRKTIFIHAISIYTAAFCVANHT